MDQEPFEVLQSTEGTVRIVFSHSDNKLTTGALILQPGASLPKHNRPYGFDNLTQLSGRCQMTVFSVEDSETIEKVVELGSGEVLKMQKGQWHIHANPYDQTSITFFKLVGDIAEAMDEIRQTNTKLEPQER